VIRWWSEMSRQKRVGWTIIIASLCYIAYFLKTRLFAPGAPIEPKEWVYFILMLGGIMLGTINVRMAEMRERNQKIAPFIVDAKSSNRK
jgi:hypothetical protein